MTRITLITLGLSLTACAASPSKSTPTSADYDDIAQTIATSTATASATTTGGSSLGAGDVIAIRDAVSLARGILPFGFLRDRDGHFRGDHMGVGSDFAIACKDASGAAQTTCNSMTDSATVTVMLKGSLETPNFSASIDRE